MEITKIQELAYELKIVDAMTKEVVTVNPEIKIRDLRKLLQENRISGVPVVEEERLVGVISLEDFIKCLAEGKTEIKIGERMIKKVETIYSEEPLITAVNKFEQFGFGRFPVIERETGKLVGILTKGDIIKALLKELEIDYHEDEIRKFRASHIFEDIISDSTTLIFEYNIIGSDFKKAGEASTKLKRNLLRLGIDRKTIRRLAIATYESEMNIVIFTSGGRIIVYIKPDKIKVEAIDTGPGISDIEQALKPGFSTAPSWVRELGFGAGMGLPNIKSCTDRLDIRSKTGEGTKLEFVVNIN